MIEFILARYNYWIVIILMLTGLYIVFSRGNLVKTVIGLNVFQTSVFFLYITLGKVAGGTAPILLAGHGDEGHGGEHGDGHAPAGVSARGPQAAHGDAHGDAHAAAHGDAAHPVADDHHEVGHDAPMNEAQSHGTEAHGADAMSPEEAASFVSGDAANAIGVNEPGTASASSLPEESLHDFSEIAAANSLLEQMPEMAPETAAPEITLSQGHAEAAIDTHAAGHDMAGEAAQAASDVIYSNPLPHVLILTAIVVGVATTAVGLALAVRIREAYGTIEEDALETMDNEAATGSPTGEGGEA